MVALANGLLGIRGLFFIPIITKYMGEAPYGIWTQIILFVGLTSKVATLGLRNSISRFLSAQEDTSKLREGFYSCVFFSLGISMLMVLIAKIMILSLETVLQIQDLQVINLGILLIPLYALDIVSFSFFLARRRVKTYSILTIFKGYGEIALVYLFINLGQGLPGAIRGAIITRVILSFFLLALVFREIGFSVPKFTRMREFLSYGIPTIASTLSSWILRFCDRYIIRLFYNDSMVGIYSAAYGIGRSVNFILPPLTLVLNPTIFNLWEKDKKTRAQEFITRTLKFFLLLAIPACFGLAILAKPLLLFLSTKTIAEQGSIIAPFVAVGITFYGICVILSRVFPLHKHTRRLGTIWVLAAASNVIMNFVLLPGLGILGAALATTLSYLIALILIYAWSRGYEIGLAKFPSVFVLKSLLASTVMIIVVWFTKGLIKSLPLMLIISVGSGIAVYFAAILLIKGLTKQELEFIKQFTKNLLP